MDDARKISPITIFLGEDFDHAIDFGPVLNGRTIVSASRASYIADSGVIDTTCCPDNPAISGDKLLLRLVGNARGISWRVYVMASLSNNDVIGHLLFVDCI